MASKNPCHKCLTVAEVADRLGCQDKTVRRRLADGTLHHHRLGGLIRITKEDSSA